MDSTIKPPAPHTVSGEKALEHWQSTHHGLTNHEVAKRLEVYGQNTLPKSEPPSLVSVFLHQFSSPLIYVLAAAALLSIIIEEWSDAGFIVAVLLINAIIGTTQEFSAQRAATALNKLVTTRCRVIREGDAYEIDSEQLVPGDILLLESGDRIPADMRLLSTNDLEIDESLLTGESTAVLKNPSTLHKTDTTVGDRNNMTFAGTLVNRGRGKGLVVATAFTTELGRLAQAVLGKQP
ncbi:MAG: HAD-IC family P-type ATPase, partial [Gammaproteobacteria bacterium]